MTRAPLASAGLARPAKIPRWERPLWTCPKCGNAFVSRNLSHSCVRVPLAAHFRGRTNARALFDALRRTIGAIGPVRIVSSKTRICFMVRVRFASCSVRHDWLRAAMWVTYPAAPARAIRREFLPPRYHLFTFALRTPADIDAEFRRLLKDAYRAGCHLKPPRRPPAQR